MNEQQINLTNLSINDVNAILAGLGKLPLELSIDVWSKIKMQADSQIKNAVQDTLKQEKK
jgi:hypothetical protein